jgi:hypothetical protein
MRVAIVGDGTTGDLQPFCGLAYALYARQHEVLVIANENHRAMLAPLVKAGVVLSRNIHPGGCTAYSQKRCPSDKPLGARRLLEILGGIRRNSR